MNDVGNSLTPTYWFLEEPSSHLFEFIEARLWNPGIGRDARTSYILPVFGPYQDGKDYWHDLYDTNSPSWESVLDGFDRISMLASEKRIPVLIVIYPFLLKEGWRVGSVDHIHGQVRSAAELSGFHVIDLLDVYQASPVESLLSSDTDGIYYPNKEAHLIACKAIYPEVADLVNLNDDKEHNVGSDCTMMCR